MLNACNEDEAGGEEVAQGSSSPETAWIESQGCS